MRVTPRIVTGQSDWDAATGRPQAVATVDAIADGRPGRDCCGDRVWH